MVGGAGKEGALVCCSSPAVPGRLRTLEERVETGLAAEPRDADRLRPIASSSAVKRLGLGAVPLLECVDAVLYTELTLYADSGGCCKDAADGPVKCVVALGRPMAGDWNARFFIAR